MEYLLYLINIIHLLYLLFIIIVPFTNSNYLLLLHSIIVPFMVLHWITNNNTCSLTIAEHYIRKELYGGDVDKNECFTSKLIEPIYDFTQNYEQFSNYIYIITILLWCLSTGKLVYKYHIGEIKGIVDLMKL